MKICCLGAGTWGVCLANLLASNGHQVVVWGRDLETLSHIQKTGKHPKLGELRYANLLHIEPDLGRALSGADLIVESVSSKGIRPVFEQVIKVGMPKCPVVISSKGIEQGTGYLMPELLRELLGPNQRIACLSGPSHAEEVVRELPTTVVAASYDRDTMMTVCELFTNKTFRVYPNADINGVAFGGALKNPISIACGVCDGIGLGDNTKAALMTRGLHEMRKLSVVKQCNPETLNGLSGMGDLCVTCLSTHSRNYRFGRLIAEGQTASQARETIGMVVEGVYACISAVELSSKANIPIPITHGIYEIIYENKSPLEVLRALMQRTIKDELL